MSTEDEIKDIIQRHEQAAESGDSDAMYKLATIYDKGIVGTGSIEPDLKRAIQWYERAACGGKIEAMLYLCVAYEKGKGDIVPVDMIQATHWYERAANHGNISAMMNLGAIYLTGKGGITINVEKAMNWFESAAEKGNVNAMFNLAVINHKGRGDVVPNMERAVYWYERAANSGNTKAMYYLAYIYDNGEVGIPSDVEKAVQLYVKAATEGGMVEAMVNLAVIYSNGQGIVAADNQKSVYWYEEAGKKGRVDAMFHAASMYDSGSGNLSADVEKAIYWYEQAAQGGMPQAAFNLGLIYHSGQGGIPIDIDRAVQWWKQAAEGGHVNAMYNLGIIYKAPVNTNTNSSGNRTIQPDIQQAIHWFQQAVEHGDHVESMFILGGLYDQGYGDTLPSDAEQAVHWYKRAAQYDHVKSMYNLGHIYDTGYGSVASNIDRAIRWYERAAEGGHTTAMYHLGLLYDHEDQIDQAIHWYEQASKLGGSIMSRFNLGLTYYYGCGNVEIDEERAVYWFEHGSSGSTNIDSDEEWARQWCRYKLGEIYHKQGKIDIARIAFTKNVEDSFHIGYIGLAMIESDDNIKIQLLIQAAEYGIVEAWIQLTKYIHNTLLHKLWTVDKIAILRSFLSMKSKWNISCNSDHVVNCLLCNPKSICSFVRGVRQEDYIPPTSHIKTERLEIHESTFNTFHGRGGQGEVKFTRLQNMDRSTTIVALKRPLYQDASHYIHLESELRHLQLLQDSLYIVKCLGHTMISDELYLIMEGAVYGDLSKLITNTTMIRYLEQPYGIKLILQWMIEMMDGIRHMHRVFVRHGDLKPQNILVFDDLHVKLADLGLSNKNIVHRETASLHEVNSDDDEFEVDIDIDLTKTKNDSVSGSATKIQGTFVYMPPEQRCGNPPTLLSDIFSFAMTCIHIINGHAPTVSYKKEFDKAKRNCLDLYGANKEIVDRVIDILEKCLSDADRQRPSSEECYQMLTEGFLVNKCDEINDLISDLDNAKLFSM